MSDSNQVKISLVEEVTEGVTPSANLQVMNYTTESLTGQASSVQSQIVGDGDGNVKDQIRTGFNAGGGINLELGHQYVEQILTGAFRSAFGTATSLTDTDIAMAVAGDVGTITDATGDGFTNIKTNDIIMVSGFATAGNNGAMLVIDKVANDEIDVMAIEPSKTLTAEAAGETVTITSKSMRNANTKRSFSIERFYQDVTEYMAFLGMIVDTVKLEFGVDAVATIAVTFQGTSHPAIVSTIGTGYDAASTNEVIDTENGFLGALISNNGAAFSDADGGLTRVEISITNNVRIENTLNAGKQTGLGDFDVKVNYDMYFKNQTYYSLFQSDGYSSLAFAVVDGSNQGLGFCFPKLKYTQADAPGTGRNQSVTVTYQCQAIGVTVDSEKYTGVVSVLG
jgi:hypothetical protein